jgi:hypothetical protein
MKNIPVIPHPPYRPDLSQFSAGCSPVYESGTRPSIQMYVYVEYDKDYGVPGCLTVRHAPRDVIVADVGDPSAMGEFRHDQKPTFISY